MPSRPPERASRLPAAQASLSRPGGDGEASSARPGLLLGLGGGASGGGASGGRALPHRLPPLLPRPQVVHPQGWQNLLVQDGHRGAGARPALRPPRPLPCPPLLLHAALCKLWAPNSVAPPPLLAPPQNTQPRGIIEVNKCLSIKGAEDAINKPHAFEISTTDQNMYFIADSDKVGWRLVVGFVWRLVVLVHPARWLSWQAAAAAAAAAAPCSLGPPHPCREPPCAQLRVPTLAGSLHPRLSPAAFACSIAGEGGLDQCGGAGHRAALQEV